MCSKENPMWSEFGKAFLLLVGSHHSPPTGHCFLIWRQPLPLHVSTVTWWMYVGQSVLVLIRTDRCSDVPIAPSADQQNNIRLQHGGSWFVWHTELQQIGRSLQTQLIQYSPEGWSHSERSKFIVPPGPSHLTTCHWPPYPPWSRTPLQTPLVIQYAQTEPFDPAAPLGITRSLWKWKGLQSKGLCTFCASKPQIMYLETFKSGLLFLSYLGF